MTNALILPPSYEEGLSIPGRDKPVFDLRLAFAQINADAGFMPRGTNTEGDVITQTIDGRSLNDVWQEFQASLAFWNEQRSTLVSALTFPVTQVIEDVPQLAETDFEEASEFGEPKGLRGGDYFQMAYDFKWYDLAIRYTWKFLAESTAAQVSALNAQALEADNRLIFSKVLKAILNNVNRTANIRGQNYTVFPFYNNDGTVPPKWKTTTHLSTHNHYITSGAATVNSGDLDEMATHLKHHGYDRQNGATLVLLVNSVELATIRTFRVATGSQYDFIPAAGQAPWLLPTVTGGVVNPQGGGVPTSVNGLPVSGQYGQWLIVEEDYIPAGYMVGFATGGRDNVQNPVGFREHQNTGLRGLRLVKGAQPDYPLVDSFYNRGFGTGIRHRGAGIVMQVTAAGSYTIPADYA